MQLANPELKHIAQGGTTKLLGGSMGINLLQSEVLFFKVL